MTWMQASSSSRAMPIDVVLGAAEGRHLLLLHRPLDGAQLVARDRRLLVAQRLAVMPPSRCAAAPRSAPGLPSRKSTIWPIVSRYGGLLDRLDARALASVDEVEQAGPLEHPLPLGDVEVAGAEREDLAQQLEGLVDAGGRCVRAEVAAPVADEPPGADDPREVLAQRDLHERVALVVPQPDVEARPMLLDQVALEEVRLADRVGDDVLDVGDLGHHPDDPRVLRAARAEVRARRGRAASPPCRRRGRGRRGVLHEVHAGGRRQPAQHGAQRCRAARAGGSWADSRSRPYRPDGHSRRRPATAVSL